MRIDIWTDYACPYCYIGKHHLKNVLHGLSMENTSIYHHVYLLEPGKISHPDQTYLEGLNIQDEVRLQKIEKLFANITEMAAEVGLPFQMDRVLNISTLDAHRLTLWAQEKNLNLGESLSERIFYATFCEGLDISSHEQLLTFCADLGLPVVEAEAILSGNAYMDQIFADADAAETREIELIPHYVFNGADELKGILSEKSMADAIARTKDLY